MWKSGGNYEFGIERRCPSPQTQIDVFAGQWNYRLPLDGVESGNAGTFVEPRPPFLDGCRRHFGEFAEFKVLELGPLEGEITHHLSQMGPASILSIEARQISYLKCLILKNLLSWDRVQFALGDFCAYLRETEEHYDFCCAQGVLYHMIDPVGLLHDICQKSDRVYVGTHYFDREKLMAVSDRDGYLLGHKNPAWIIPDDCEVAYEGHGLSLNLYKHLYRVTRDVQESPDKDHHHGVDMYAYFMKKDDIITALESFGMEVLDVEDQPEMPRGPFVSIIARKVA